MTNHSTWNGRSGCLKCRAKRVRFEWTDDAKTNVKAVDDPEGAWELHLESSWSQPTVRYPGRDAMHEKYGIEPLVDRKSELEKDLDDLANRINLVRAKHQVELAFVMHKKGVIGVEVKSPHN